MSTRMIGAVIMAHGDDQGLRLPPRLAPYQAVLVPIYRDDGQRSAILERLCTIKDELNAAGIRAHLDDREGISPGYKFNDWELRGVPVRVDMGPRDLANGNIILSRRDKPGKAGKLLIPQEACQPILRDLLVDIQQNLFEEARRFRDENIQDVRNYDELRQVIESNAGWARGWWAGSDEDEQRVQQETGATIRCFPLEQPTDDKPCFFTGAHSAQIALFARAY